MTDSALRKENDAAIDHLDAQARCCTSRGHAYEASVPQVERLKAVTIDMHSDLEAHNTLLDQMVGAR